ncbi:MAG: zinc ribbon domain-containing protein [Oscillospiraceae bacterium]|nr:zinc ribbon domain-containing protein [Oscillospiraceae bacterium]
MGKEHSVPRIISNELWQEVQDKLNSYPRIIKKGKNLFLLKDLMYCSCGRKMYGHFQGLNNHYYCSSAHTGKKCNTRGICKENAENIVYQIIYNRLIFDVFTNEESPIHRLLQMDAKL